jgi:type I restriction enzyme, R subunit
MATGTGKTRVAMAIIDVLLKTNRAQKVLFLADRKALRNQANDEGYKKFFPEESRSKILSGNFDKTSRLYVSTIQTFQEIYNKKDSSGKYMISPAEFDLIISDEAHRSIYNKWRDVFTYLDAIQIGLTATPSELLDRDTFKFFNCLDGRPTALYDYEEAVREGILCDFRRNILGAQTHFQITGIKPEDLTSGEFTRLLEEGIDPDNINFEGTELEKKVAVTGTSESIVREFRENCQMDKSGNHPAKTIFFAVSKKHARRLHEAFERLYPEYKGLLARVIVSEDSRADKLVKDFKEEDWPRVAISVDMLDTGIDVPEVCNLVFAKPVLSKIKFWQMLGRGTRSDHTCKHRDWLPDGKKEYFKVFDFWRNFENFDLNPDGDQQQSKEAITSRIFMVRLKQLANFRKRGAEVGVEEVKAKILEDIESLPKDSVSVRERLQDVEKALSPRLWSSIGIDPVKFLQDRITPLMKFKPDVNLNEASFTLRCERLGLAVLNGEVEEIQRLKPEIGEMIECLPTNLDLIRPKYDLIQRVLSEGFWQNLSFDDSQMLVRELSGLMKYMSKEPRKTIIIDMDDLIQKREKIVFGPDCQEEYVTVYKEKVEEKIKKLAEEHAALKKIRQGEELDEEDLRSLEETLNSPELFINEETLRKTYKQRAGTLVEFIKKVLGLIEFQQPEERIWDAFQTYIIENNRHYTADQLNFVRAIRTVFARKKHLDFGDLFEAPFSNFGVNAPMPMFSEDELKSFINICGSLEKELFAEA